MLWGRTLRDADSKAELYPQKKSPAPKGREARDFSRGRFTKSEIAIGKVYSNGKGRQRLVVDMGPQYKAYSGQVSTENLCYAPIKNGEPADKRENMTVAAFASWAKEIVD